MEWDTGKRYYVRKAADLKGRALLQYCRYAKERIICRRHIRKEGRPERDTA